MLLIRITRFLHSLAVQSYANLRYLSHKLNGQNMSQCYEKVSDTVILTTTKLKKKKSNNSANEEWIPENLNVAHVTPQHSPLETLSKSFLLNYLVSRIQQILEWLTSPLYVWCHQHNTKKWHSGRAFSFEYTQ